MTKIHRKHSFDCVNYLDDFGGADTVLCVQQAFMDLGKILERIGILESVNKAVSPSTKVTFLGILFDTKKLMMFITPERMQEIRELLELWLNKTEASLHEMQVLLGKLNFVCSTVRLGRVFVSRIINRLKGLEDDKLISIDPEFRKDLIWWKKFMSEFDGRTMITDLTWSPPDVCISTDATLKYCGGWSEGEYWCCEFPEWLSKDENIFINELETVALIIGLKVWREKVRNKNILMHCDNQCTVDIVNTGQASNEFAQKCLCEICYMTATINSVIKVVFCPRSRQPNG